MIGLERRRAGNIRRLRAVNGRVLLRDKKETVYQQWGGSTATFFTYTHFSHDLCAGLLAALLPLIKISLGLNYFQSGLLLAAYTITSGLSQFPGGWISDRVRPQVVIGVGLGGIGLASLAVGLSPSYYPMLAIFIIMGIFAGGYHPSAVTLLSAYYAADKRGKVIALHMMGGSIGFALGPMLGGLIAGLMSWRYAFFAMAVPALVAVPLVFKKLRRRSPEERGRDAGKTFSAADYGVNRPPRQPDILSVLRPIAIIISLAILIQLLGGTVMAFFPIYLVDKLGVTPTAASLLIGITRGGGILGSLIGGWLSDRWGRKPTIFMTLAATGPVLYLLTRLDYSAGMIVVMIVFGVFMYMRQATVQPFLMDSVPATMRGTIFGIYFGLGMEGMSLLQPVAGFFMDRFDITSVFNVIALSTVALSVLTLLLMKKVSLPKAA